MDNMTLGKNSGALRAPFLNKNSLANFSKSVPVYSIGLTPHFHCYT